MPISIDNTNYLNNEYGRYSADTAPVREGTVSSRTSDNLPAGKTVTGEIIEKDGDQVTIKLSNDQTISARLSGNADIEVGMKMTFEVATRNNQVALRPLFSNLTNNSAAMSALKAAGLPVNNTTLAMTDRMMTESMPVNRNALADMFRSVSAHGNVSPETIVQMRKLDMPLTETNVIQFDNYRNFQHQITGDLANVSDGIADLFKEAVMSADSTVDMGGAAAEVSQSYGNLSAQEVITEVLNLIDTDSLETVMPSGADMEKAAQLLAAKAEMSAAEAADKNISDKSAAMNNETASAGNAAAGVDGPGSAASLIRSTVDGLISDVRDLFSSGGDGGTDIALNSNITLTADEQLSLSTDLQDILILAEKGPAIRQPLDPSEVMTAVKELVKEYPPGIDKIAETENPTYSQESEEALDNGKLLNAARDDITALKEDPAAPGGQVRDPLQPQNGADTKDALRAGINDKAALLAENLIDEDNAASTRQKITEKLTGLLRSEGFSKLLKDSVKAQMSIKPEDVSQNGKIEELYSRIQKTSSKISRLMENIGRDDTAAARSSAALTDNVNFMNRLNEFVSYVQLPLKMAGEDANGELYVYTNKKNLANNDGNYSALLHLDMEHLGPMDIYVTMRDHIKVSTNFYLQSEDLLDFMEAHIDMLTKRLAEKGYDTSMRVIKKEKGEPLKPITDEFTKDEARPDTPVMVSKMRFDVRA